MFGLDQAGSIYPASGLVILLLRVGFIGFRVFTGSRVFIGFRV